MFSSGPPGRSDATNRWRVTSAANFTEVGLAFPPEPTKEICLRPNLGYQLRIPNPSPRHRRPGNLNVSLNSFAELVSRYSFKVTRSILQSGPFWHFESDKASKVII